jgi:hypothetical protein
MEFPDPWWCQFTYYHHLSAICPVETLVNAPGATDHEIKNGIVYCAVSIYCVIHRCRKAHSRCIVKTFEMQVMDNQQTDKT